MGEVTYRSRFTLGIENTSAVLREDDVLRCVRGIILRGSMRSVENSVGISNHFLLAVHVDGSLTTSLSSSIESSKLELFSASREGISGIEFEFTFLHIGMGITDFVLSRVGAS